MRGDISRRSSSSTKRNPASGALNAAASPAPPPAAISVRRERRGMRPTRPKISPIAAPRWIVGPSRPSDIPAVSAAHPPITFTTTNPRGRIGRRPMIAALRLRDAAPARIRGELVHQESGEAPHRRAEEHDAQITQRAPTGEGCGRADFRTPPSVRREVGSRPPPPRRARRRSRRRRGCDDGRAGGADVVGPPGWLGA